MGNNISNDDFWAELDRRIVDARTERKLFIEEITSLRQQLASFKESYQVLRCAIEQALALGNDGSYILAWKVLQRTLSEAAPTATIEGTPELADGETYLGIQTNSAGQPYHLILLPGDIQANWNDAMAWAKEQGGDLPNRIEQAMLWANHRDKFEPVAYWSNEQPVSESSWAWSQDFGNGNQSYYRKYLELRARAIRRLPI